MAKLLYRPFALLVTVFGGMIAGAVFQRLWKLTARSNDAPDATDQQRDMKEILAASALQGALLGLTKALLHRGGAAGIRRVTGTWPA